MSISTNRILIEIHNFKREQELIKRGHILFYLFAFLRAVNKLYNRDC